MGLESVPFGVRPKALFPEAKRSLCFTGQSLRFIQTKALFLFIGNAVLREKKRICRQSPLFYRNNTGSSE